MWNRASDQKSGKSEPGEQIGMLWQLWSVQWAQCKYPKHLKHLIYFHRPRIVYNISQASPLMGYLKCLQLSWTTKCAGIFPVLAYSLFIVLGMFFFFLLYVRSWTLHSTHWVIPAGVWCLYGRRKCWSFYRYTVKLNSPCRLLTLLSKAVIVNIQISKCTHDHFRPTNRLPTGRRHVTKLSAVYRPTVGRLLTDRQPTVGRQCLLRTVLHFYHHTKHCTKLIKTWRQRRGFVEWYHSELNMNEMEIENRKEIWQYGKFTF